jgi:hypothetical protein
MESKHTVVASHSSPTEKVLVHNKQQAGWAGFAEKNPKPLRGITPQIGLPTD